MQHRQRISTHALTEGDGQFHIHSFKKIIFQLTPSRRATAHVVVTVFRCDISTHALTEGDHGERFVVDRHRDFNSRPHGGRRDLPGPRQVLLSFQLTPSRRATLARLQLAMRIGISTHALTEGDSSSWELIPKLFISTHALTEGDGPARISIIFFSTFQLTPSRRATRRRNIRPIDRIFQLTPSRRAT